MMLDAVFDVLTTGLHAREGSGRIVGGENVNLARDLTSDRDREQRFRSGKSYAHIETFVSFFEHDHVVGLFVTEPVTPHPPGPHSVVERDVEQDRTVGAPHHAR